MYNDEDGFSKDIAILIDVKEQPDNLDFVETDELTVVGLVPTMNMMKAFQLLLDISVNYEELAEYDVALDEVLSHS